MSSADNPAEAMLALLQRSDLQSSSFSHAASSFRELYPQFRNIADDTLSQYYRQAQCALRFKAYLSDKAKYFDTKDDRKPTNEERALAGALRTSARYPQNFCVTPIHFTGVAMTKGTEHILKLKISYSSAHKEAVKLCVTPAGSSIVLRTKVTKHGLRVFLHITPRVLGEYSAVVLISSGAESIFVTVSGTVEQSAPFPPISPRTSGCVNLHIDPPSAETGGPKIEFSDREVSTPLDSLTACSRPKPNECPPERNQALTLTKPDASQAGKDLLTIKSSDRDDSDDFATMGPAGKGIVGAPALTLTIPVVKAQMSQDTSDAPRKDCSADAVISSAHPTSDSKPDKPSVSPESRVPIATDKITAKDIPSFSDMSDDFRSDDQDFEINDNDFKLTEDQILQFKQDEKIWNEKYGVLFDDSPFDQNEWISLCSARIASATLVVSSSKISFVN